MYAHAVDTHCVYIDIFIYIYTQFNALLLYIYKYTERSSEQMIIISEEE